MWPGKSHTANPSSCRCATVSEYLACTGDDESCWPWADALSTAGSTAGLALVLLERPRSERGAVLGDDSAVRRLLTVDTAGGISPPALDVRPSGGLAGSDWMTSGGGGGRCPRPIRDGAEWRSSCGEAIVGDSSERWRPSPSDTSSTTFRINWVLVQSNLRPTEHTQICAPPPPVWEICTRPHSICCVASRYLSLRGIGSGWKLK